MTVRMLAIIDAITVDNIRQTTPIVIDKSRMWVPSENNQTRSMSKQSPIVLAADELLGI